MCLLGFSRYDLQTGLEWEFCWLLFLPVSLLWLLVSSPLCAGLYSASPHFLPSRASRARVWSQVLQRWSGLCTVATLKAGQIQAQRQGMSCLSSSRDRFSSLPFLVPQLSRIRRSGSKAGIVSFSSFSVSLFWSPSPGPMPHPDLWAWPQHFSPHHPPEAGLQLLLPVFNLGHCPAFLFCCRQRYWYCVWA